MGVDLVPFMTRFVPQDVGLKAVCHHRHPGSQQLHTFHLFIPHITKQQQRSGGACIDLAALNLLPHAPCGPCDFSTATNVVVVVSSALHDVDFCGILSVPMTDGLTD